MEKETWYATLFTFKPLGFQKNLWKFLFQVVWSNHFSLPKKGYLEGWSQEAVGDQHERDFSRHRRLDISLPFFWCGGTDWLPPVRRRSCSFFPLGDSRKDREKLRWVIRLMILIRCIKPCKQWGKESTYQLVQDLSHQQSGVSWLGPSSANRRNSSDFTDPTDWKNPLTRSQPKGPKNYWTDGSEIRTQHLGCIKTCR